MSFSDEFGFDELDPATLRELDAIEASSTAPPKPMSSAPPPVTSNLSVQRAARLARIERELASSNTFRSIKPLRAPSATVSRPLSTTNTSKFKPVRQTTRDASPTIILDNDDDPIRDFDPPNQPESYAATHQKDLPTASTSKATAVIDVDSFTDDDFFLDEFALEEIDLVTDAALFGKPFVTTDKLTRQTTLTGAILPQAPARTSFTRTKSNNNGPSKPTASKSKNWSHQTALARTGPGRKSNDPKGKGKARADDEEEVETDLPPPPTPGLSSLLCNTSNIETTLS